MFGVCVGLCTARAWRASVFRFLPPVALHKQNRQQCSVWQTKKLSFIYDGRARYFRGRFIVAGPHTARVRVNAPDVRTSVSKSMGIHTHTPYAI